MPETKTVRVSTGTAGTSEFKEIEFFVPLLNKGNYKKLLSEAEPENDPEVVLFELVNQAYQTNLMNTKRRELSAPEGASLTARIRGASPEVKDRIKAMLDSPGADRA